MRIPQVRARGLLLWWGRFRFMFGHATFYVSMVSMIMLAATTYNTTARDWALEYLGIELSFWGFMGLLIITVGLGLIVEFMISVPALIAVSNEQMYKHDSPIKTDFEEVKQELSAIKEKMNELNEKLDAQNPKIEGS